MTRGQYRLGGRAVELEILRIVAAAPERHPVRLVPYFEFPVGYCRAEARVGCQLIEEAPDQCPPVLKRRRRRCGMTGHGLGKEVQAHERYEAAGSERLERAQCVRKIHRGAGSGPYNSTVEGIVIYRIGESPAVEGVEKAYRPESRRRCRHLVEEALKRRLQQPIDVILAHHVELAGTHRSLRPDSAVSRATGLG